MEALVRDARIPRGEDPLRGDLPEGVVGVALDLVHLGAVATGGLKGSTRKSVNLYKNFAAGEKHTDYFGNCYV